METVLQDVRYGLRLLWKQRGFSVVAILTLALGIGLSTTLFSVIDAALVNPLPYPGADRLVNVAIESRQADGRASNLGGSYRDLRAMSSVTGPLEEIAMWRHIFTAPVADGADPERLQGYEVGPRYFALHGVTPVAGRVFEETDLQVGAAPVVIIGHRYWQRRYGGDRHVIGQSIRFEDSAATIVGVLPEHFDRTTALWRPLPLTQFVEGMRGSGATTYARLREGVTIEAAQTALTDVLALQPGATATDKVVLRSLLGSAKNSYRATVNILAGAVGVILLLACVNVAGLLLARGTTRLSELSIRASIGAGRWRLARQLLTESLVLSTVGGLAGMLIAWWSLDALVANLPFSLSSNAPATLNLRVLGMSTALAIVTGLIFGLAPAWRLSRTGASTSLARGARRVGSPLTRRGGQALIAVEVALAVVLLASAGLMLRSFGKLLSVDLGFRPESFITLETQTVDAKPATLGQYYPALLDALRQLPGVSAVGAINHLPLMGTSMNTRAKSDGGHTAGIIVRQVLPGYFEAVGLQPTLGRVPAELDRTAGRSVLVLNEKAATDLFPDRSPLGGRVTINKDVLEVIGVIADIRFGGPMRPSASEVYRLFHPADDPSPPRSLIAVLRPVDGTRIPEERLRQIAGGLGTRVLIDRIRTGSDWLDATVITPKRRTVLLTLLGGLGLLLALVGVFGMTAYAVARRTQEIGVRMAFGARPSDVVRTIVGDAARPIVAGVVVGVGGAYLATRAISTFLFNTTATDPVTFGLTALTLGAAACVAAWIPARRAARVNPVQALRSD